MPLPDDERDRIANPPPATGSTPVNPGQQSAVDAATRYEQDVSSASGAEIDRALQRARDEISVGMRAEGEGAMGRGADAGLFRSRALQSGERGLHELQGRLTDVALGRRQGAVDSLTGATHAAAGEQRMMHLGTMAARVNEQRLLMEQAELQHRMREAPYQRLAGMVSRVSSGSLGGGGASGSLGGGGGVLGARRSVAPTATRRPVFG